MRKTLKLAGLLAALAVLAFSPGILADSSSEFFNGKDLTGWEGQKDLWSVKDGALVGETPPPGGIKSNTFLCSTRKYTDFELSFQVRLKGGVGNSGVQVRSKLVDPEKNPYVVGGPQADIGGGYWGSLYGERFGGMMKQSPKAVVDKVKKDDFNDYYIKVVGKHVTIKLNGETAVDEDFEKMPDDGIIAWQLHAGPPMEVTFKNIKFLDHGKK
jgi:hypothetical protein